jgi:hypothetical protein
MIVQRTNADGTVQAPYSPADDELALAFIVVAAATAIDTFSLRIDPNNDGGWTEAPAPRVCWDPRTSGQERSHD